MNTRNFVVAAGAAFALSVLATSCRFRASGTTSATATASVTVVAATSITKTQDMVFGTLVRPTTPIPNTTIAMDANGSTSPPPAAPWHSVVTSTTSAAKFNITVQAATTYHAGPDADLHPGRPDQCGCQLPWPPAGTIGTIGAVGTQEDPLTAASST